MRELIYSRKQIGTIFNFYIDDMHLTAEIVRDGTIKKAILIKGLPELEDLGSISAKEGIKAILERGYFVSIGDEVHINMRILGGWGEDIHDGTKRMDPLIVGTYTWVKRVWEIPEYNEDCMAEHIARTCNKVDSWRHVVFGEPTDPLFCQGRHFNVNEAGQTDSRIQFAFMHFHQACTIMKNSGSEARLAFCEELGKGLHSIQDIFAHDAAYVTTKPLSFPIMGGSVKHHVNKFGKLTDVPKHIRRGYFDLPDDISDGEICETPTVRYFDTQCATYIYLICFRIAVANSKENISNLVTHLNNLLKNNNAGIYYPKILNFLKQFLPGYRIEGLHFVTILECSPMPYDFAINPPEGAIHGVPEGTPREKLRDIKILQFSISECEAIKILTMSPPKPTVSAVKHLFEKYPAIFFLGLFISSNITKTLFKNFTNIDLDKLEPHEKALLLMLENDSTLVSFTPEAQQFVEQTEMTGSERGNAKDHISVLLECVYSEYDRCRTQCRTRFITEAASATERYPYILYLVHIIRKAKKYAVEPLQNRAFARAYYIIGCYYKEQYLFEEAETTFQIALSLLGQDITNRALEVDILWAKGGIPFLYRKDHKKAISDIEQAYEIAKNYLQTRDNEFTQLEKKRHIAVAYIRLGKLGKARRMIIEEVMSAMHLREDSDVRVSAINKEQNYLYGECLTSLAYIEYFNGEIDKAEMYLTKALKLFKDLCALPVDDVESQYGNLKYSIKVILSRTFLAKIYFRRWMCNLQDQETKIKAESFFQTNISDMEREGYLTQNPAVLNEYVSNCYRFAIMLQQDNRITQAKEIAGKMVKNMLTCYCLTTGRSGLTRWELFSKKLSRLLKEGIITELQYGKLLPLPTQIHGRTLRAIKSDSLLSPIERGEVFFSGDEHLELQMAKESKDMPIPVPETDTAVLPPPSPPRSIFWHARCNSGAHASSEFIGGRQGTKEEAEKELHKHFDEVHNGQETPSGRISPA